MSYDQVMMKMKLSRSGFNNFAKPDFDNQPFPWQGEYEVDDRTSKNSGSKNQRLQIEQTASRKSERFG